jgi:hypothetical protein
MWDRFLPSWRPLPGTLESVRGEVVHWLNVYKEDPWYAYRCPSPSCAFQQTMHAMMTTDERTQYVLQACVDALTASLSGRGGNPDVHRDRQRTLLFFLCGLGSDTVCSLKPSFEGVLRAMAATPLEQVLDQEGPMPRALAPWPAPASAALWWRFVKRLGVSEAWLECTPVHWVTVRLRLQEKDGTPVGQEGGVVIVLALLVFLRASTAEQKQGELDVLKADARVCSFIAEAAEATGLGEALLQEGLYWHELPAGGVPLEAQEEHGMLVRLGAALNGGAEEEETLQGCLSSLREDRDLLALRSQRLRRAPEMLTRILCSSEMDLEPFTAFLVWLAFDSYHALARPSPGLFAEPAIQCMLWEVLALLAVEEGAFVAPEACIRVHAEHVKGVAQRLAAVDAREAALHRDYRYCVAVFACLRQPWLLRPFVLPPAPRRLVASFLFSKDSMRCFFSPGFELRHHQLRDGARARGAAQVSSQKQCILM